jgi:hypothetical protein
VFLGNTGLTISGYENLTVAIILWSLMIPAAGFAVWPWIKRVRISLAPPEGDEPQAKNEAQPMLGRVRETLREVVGDEEFERHEREQKDEQLKRRCIALGHELRKFIHAQGYSNETVARFNQRHEWKLNELREELDERGWLSPQERDMLTFYADDYSHKIEDIAETLIAIGRGH